MDEEKVFKELGERNAALWGRLQEYSQLLNLSPEDAEVFTTDKSAAMIYFINNFVNNLVAVGDHLARVRKWRSFMENKKARVFGKLYVEVTEECLNGRNSSKFDKEYRTGKVMANDELKQLSKLIAELQEYEDRLEAIQSALRLKGMTLTAMTKLDKYNF